MQVSIEEAQGSQSWQWEKNLLLREQKTWLKMIVTDKPEFSCFEYKIWKLPCLSVLTCWKFEYKHAKWTWRYPAVFQPFCCMSNVTHCWANIAATVTVHIHIYTHFNQRQEEMEAYQAQSKSTENTGSLRKTRERKERRHRRVERRERKTYNFFFESNSNLKTVEVVSTSTALATSSWQLIRVTHPDNYWLWMLNWSHITWLTHWHLRL